ncbi:MAG: hypothetical protein M1840_006452 [Geoglossum simile]|nr:MAG: hypothetical protein M1840_006452 [Geoglossum simile]
MGTALCLYPAETSLRKQYERRTTSQERHKHRTDGIAVSGREQAIEVRVRKEGSRRRAGAAIVSLLIQTIIKLVTLPLRTQYDYSTPKSYFRHYKPSHYYLSPKIYATVLQLSDLIMNIFGSVRVEILNFDEMRNKAQLRITYTLRRCIPITLHWLEFLTDPLPDPPPFQNGRPPMAGLGLGSDAGHTITLPGGWNVQIPIRSPLKELLNIATIAAQAEEMLTGQVKNELVGKLYREMEGVIKRAAGGFEKSKG